MNDAQSGTGPQPAGAFDHPDAGALTEQSVTETAGYQDNGDYAEAGSGKEAAARGEAMPPRATTDVPREPIASRSRRL